jgi:hypothetical protein
MSSRTSGVGLKCKRCEGARVRVARRWYCPDCGHGAGGRLTVGEREFLRKLRGERLGDAAA